MLSEIVAKYAYQLPRYVQRGAEWPVVLLASTRVSLVAPYRDPIPYGTI